MNLTTNRTVAAVAVAAQVIGGAIAGTIAGTIVAFPLVYSEAMPLIHAAAAGNWGWWLNDYTIMSGQLFIHTTKAQFFALP